MSTLGGVIPSRCRVAGTIGSESYGVAKQANIISVKVSNDGTTQLKTLAKGLIAAIKRHSEQKTKPGFIASGMLRERNDISQRDACKAAPGASQGNTNITFINVGNLNIKDEVDVTSRLGKCVDIWAPGTDIVSVGLGKSLFSKKPIPTKLAGTSMASPLVAGVVAGEALKHPELRMNPTAMKQHILKMAKEGIVNYKPELGPNRILFRGK
ncbi:Cerevisin [Arthrobotrys entomopaga]|nr:Cerevisin [Arthrobotrys entomopaga]